MMENGFNPIDIRIASKKKLITLFEIRNGIE